MSTSLLISYWDSTRQIPFYTCIEPRVACIFRKLNLIFCQLILWFNFVSSTVFKMFKSLASWEKKKFVVRDSQFFYSSFAFGINMGICETHKCECNKNAITLVWFCLILIRNEGMVRIRIKIEIMFISNCRGLPLLNLIRYVWVNSRSII